MSLNTMSFFVDYFSKYIWLYPIKRKSDVKILFPQFKSLVEFFSKPTLLHCSLIMGVNMWVFHLILPLKVSPITRHHLTHWNKTVLPNDVVQPGIFGLNILVTFNY